jgi:hypothetical protein
MMSFPGSWMNALPEFFTPAFLCSYFVLSRPGPQPSIARRTPCPNCPPPDRQPQLDGGPEAEGQRQIQTRMMDPPSQKGRAFAVGNS